MTRRVPVSWLGGMAARRSLGLAPARGGAALLLRQALAGPLAPWDEALLPLDAVTAEAPSRVWLRGSVAIASDSEREPCAVRLGQRWFRFEVQPARGDGDDVKIALDKQRLRDASGRPFDPAPHLVSVPRLESRRTRIGPTATAFVGALDGGCDLGAPAPGLAVVFECAGRRLAATLPEPPTVLVEGPGAGRRAIELRSRHVEIDIGEGSVSVVATAALPWPTRIFVAAPGSAIDDELPRAKVRLAAEPSAPREDARTAADRAVLEAADLERLSEGTPAPTVAPATFAGITLALARRGDRAQVLAEHGFDERSWLLEERAHVGPLATAALGVSAGGAGDGQPALALGETFAAEGGRRDFSVTEYAELRLAVDAAPSPERALGERGVALSEWIALDLRMRHARATSPERRAEIDAALAAARRPQ